MYSLRLFILLCTMALASVALAQDDDEPVLPITEDVMFIIRSGDTFDGLGAIFDVSPTCLAETNNVTDMRTVRPGDQLLISVACPRYGADPRDNVARDVLIPREVVTYEDDCEGYRVQRNDSIDLIGFDLDIAPLSIAAANDLQPPYPVEVNQCLVIPDDAPEYGIVPALTTVAGDPINDDDLGTGGGSGQYVIQPQDTLDTIAAELDISLQALILFNDIDSTNTLPPGTVIYLPADAPPYGVYPPILSSAGNRIHIIVADDTLERIAEAYDVAQVALEVANEIDSDDELEIGETLIIPSNVPAFGNDDDFDPDSLIGQGGGMVNGETHVVQPLETMDEIAASYDISRDCLMERNNIRDARLTQPGTVLVIDTTCPAYIGDGIPSIEDSIRPVGED